MSYKVGFVDNYVKKPYKSSVDKVSKIYIILTMIIGVNRLPIVIKLKRIFYILSIGYGFLVNSLIIYLVLNENPDHCTNFVIISNLVQYVICSLAAVAFCDKLKNFYEQLVEFDELISMTCLINFVPKRNIVKAVIMICCHTAVFTLSSIVENMKKLSLPMLAIDYNYILQLHYYAHLLMLFEIRLKSIRILLLSSFKNENLFSENDSITITEKNIFKLSNINTHVEVRRLLLLYNKLIGIYDCLNIAIKWQLLLFLTSSFMTTLGMSYHIASSLIENNFSWNMAIPDIGLIIINIVPLAEPCACAEKLRKEVLALRTSLYLRTYNNIFDKINRRFANLLLAVTNARSFTFSLFRMIEVNSSLPFNFFGILVSYLVILLQFKKVFNNNNYEL